MPAQAASSQLSQGTARMADCQGQESFLEKRWRSTKWAAQAWALYPTRLPKHP